MSRFAGPGRPVAGDLSGTGRGVDAIARLGSPDGGRSGSLRRRCLPLAAAALLLPLLADPGPIRAVPGLDDVESPRPLPPIEAGAEPAGAPTETFDTFQLGRLPPQGGWTSSYDPIFTVVGGGIRKRSARHLSDGFGEFVSDTLLSPPFAPTDGPVAVTVRRSAGAARHQLVPVDLAAETVVTRIELAPNRRIQVAQLQAGGLVFVDTGRRWTADVPVRIGVATDGAGGLQVFVDGESAFVGVDVVFAATGVPGRTELLAFVANNSDEGTELLVDDLGPDPAGPPPGPPLVEVPATGAAGLALLAMVLALLGSLRLGRRVRGRVPVAAHRRPARAGRNAGSSSRT